ncbi:MAG: type II toxin-antitoxin system HicA family toxin [Firmicutes bacterium]|nr:type II toxin-antitoxin system HicA family toxin [Bacillota bacterium]
MPPLPRLTARELLQKLERLGFIRVRQTGSHVLVRHRDNPQRYAVMPLHSQHTIPTTLNRSLTRPRPAAPRKSRPGKR